MVNPFDLLPPSAYPPHPAFAGAHQLFAAFQFPQSIPTLNCFIKASHLAQTIVTAPGASSKYEREQSTFHLEGTWGAPVRRQVRHRGISSRTYAALTGMFIVPPTLPSSCPGRLRGRPAL